MSLKSSRKLKSKKHRLETGRFLVEGPRAVREGLNSAYPCHAVYYTNEKSLAGLPLPAGLAPVKLEEADFQELSDTISSQGVVAEFSRPDQELVGFPHSGGVLYLDAVQDPGNLGMLLRSSLGAGVNWIFLGPGSVDPFNAKAVRASAGALFHVNLRFDAADRSLLKKLKQEGFRLLGAASHGGRPAAGLSPTPKWALLAGNEGQGLSPDLETFLDECITIETNPALESLNVSVSAGILLFKLSGKI